MRSLTTAAQAGDLAALSFRRRRFCALVGAMSSGPTAAFRVLHVSQPTTMGVARCVDGLVAEQRARGWEVFVASPMATAEDPPEWITGPNFLRWDARRSPLSTGAVGEISRLRKIVKDVRPDVVHLHSSKAGLAGRLALRGSVFTVFQPHAWSFHATGRIVGPVARRWEKAAGRWADVVLCVSEGERTDAGDIGWADRSVVIPNGVDSARYHPATASERVAARAKLDLSADGLVVICVGRLSEQKGQDVLLRAWPRVLEAVPSVTLVFVGDGPELDALKASSPAGVRFVRHQEDLVPWYASADLVVMPSRYEGASLALLEAMASGLSIVATDVYGVADALDNPAATAPVGDAGAIAELVIDRLQSPSLRASEGMRLRARAAEAFDVYPFRRAVAELYQASLAAQGNKSR